MLVSLGTHRVKRKRRREEGERARTGLKVKILMVPSFCRMNHQGVLLLVSIGWLLCLAFLYGWRFLFKYPWTGRLL